METQTVSSKTVLRNGLRKGLSGYLWLLKILIPISFFMMLLLYGGWIRRLDFILEPVMGLLHLPSVAAVPLLVGIFSGIYGGIAAMAPLQLNTAQVTLMAVFMLIAHNLVQEGAVQDQSGLSFLKTTLIRLLAAGVTVAVLAQILQPGAAMGLSPTAPAPDHGSLAAALKAWAVDTLFLCGKIFGIIMPLMVLIEGLKHYQGIDRIIGKMGPLLKILGVDRRLALLWLTAALFGLAYGAAVIVKETREGGYTRDELERLQVSIGINHAMIEDPVLFVAMGVHPFWAWGPRLMAAIVALQAVRWLHEFRRKRASRDGEGDPARVGRLSPPGEGPGERP